MKTLAKRLKTEKRKNKELQKKIECMERGERALRKMIVNREVAINKEKGVARAAGIFVETVADKVGKETFEITVEELNRERHYHWMNQYDDEKKTIKFKKVKVEEQK